MSPLSLRERARVRGIARGFAIQETWGPSGYAYRPRQRSGGKPRHCVAGIPVPFRARADVSAVYRAVRYAVGSSGGQAIRFCWVVKDRFRATPPASAIGLLVNRFHFFQFVLVTLRVMRLLELAVPMRTRSVGIYGCIVHQMHRAWLPHFLSHFSVWTAKPSGENPPCGNVRRLRDQIAHPSVGS